MSARVAAAMVVVLGAVCVASLALPWYRADLPGRDVRFAATDVAPVLWVLIPVIAAVVVPVVAIVRRGWLDDAAVRRLALWSLAVATVGFTVAATALAWPPARAMAVDVAGAPRVPLLREPAGFVAVGALAGIMATLFAWIARLDRGDASVGPTVSGSD